MDAKNRDAEKRALISQFGGGCDTCGYSRSIRALHFHHVDASEKQDWSGQRGHASRAELAAHPERFKLLCATCHIEEHERLDDEKRTHIACRRCNKSVPTKPYLAANGRKQYCSRPCMIADRASVAHGNLRTRIFKYVQRTDTCWNWTGYVLKKSNTGITEVTLPDGSRQTRTARSVVYELETGTRRGKLNVSCQNSLCVNPSHALGQGKDGAA